MSASSNPCCRRYGKKLFGGELTVRRHSPAVRLSALNRTAPALRMAVASREGGDDVAVQRDGLRVVAAVVLVLVFRLYRQHKSFPHSSACREGRMTGKLKFWRKKVVERVKKGRRSGLSVVKSTVEKVNRHRELTQHSDTIPLIGLRRIILHRHLRRLRRAEQGIRKHAPGV